MKTIHIILTAVILSALCGCRSHRNQTPVPETVTLQATMSTREVHTRHTDTVFIRIPAQESERETFDSVSVLESDYAVSEARSAQTVHCVIHCVTRIRRYRSRSPSPPTPSTKTASSKSPSRSKCMTPHLQTTQNPIVPQSSPGLSPQLPLYC